MARLSTRLQGLARSLLMYYWPPGNGRRLRAFYSTLVPPGALCFDIGAHVGNRSLTFHKLGCRVVAVEPQPDFARFLRHLFRHHQGIVLEEVAIAAEPGAVELFVSAATPTVTTASKRFIDGVATLPSFRQVRWGEAVRVPALTLDMLIARHGLPDFLKLDIEGLEEEALMGLSRAPGLVSFEFLASRIADARRCLDRLETLASWTFNVSRGESLAMEWPAFVARPVLDDWLAAHAGQDFSGDIYARSGGADA